MNLIDHLQKNQIPFEQNGEHIRVGGSLYLRGTQITSVTYRKNCGMHNRTIYAAFVNNEIQIAAGCFLGNLSKFCEAVDDKYSGSAAEKYKSDAQSCHDELVKILSSDAA